MHVQKSIFNDKYKDDPAKRPWIQAMFLPQFALNKELVSTMCHKHTRPRADSFYRRAPHLHVPLTTPGYAHTRTTVRALVTQSPSELPRRDHGLDRPGARLCCAPARLWQRVGCRADGGVAGVERLLPFLHEFDAAREAHGQAVPCYQRVRAVQGDTVPILFPVHI